MHLKSEKHRTNELTKNTFNTPEGSLKAGSEEPTQIPYPGLHGLVSTQNQQIFQNVIGPKTAKKSKHKLKSLTVRSWTSDLYMCIWKNYHTTRTTRQYMKKNHAHGVFHYTLAFHIDSTEFKNGVCLWIKYMSCRVAKSNGFKHNIVKYGKPGDSFQLRCDLDTWHFQ